MDPKNRLNVDESRVNTNIDRVRARAFKLTDDYVTLAHGAGGKASAALVEQVFFEGYGNSVLAAAGDASVVPVADLVAGHGCSLAFSCDSYVVSPIQFPGGDIGDLAINGTVNDLAVSGAVPKLISAAFVLEEGLEVAVLREVVASMAAAAARAGVSIATGDTKVVPRGACDRLYITTSGVGVVPPGRVLGAESVVVGDQILVSGPIADHGMAVMLARGDLAISAPVVSDSAPINDLVEALFAAAGAGAAGGSGVGSDVDGARVDGAAPVRWLRDATRGGVGTVLNELARSCGFGVAINDEAVPVRAATRGVCDMLGIDPLYVANEGTFIAVVSPDFASAALAALRAAGADSAALIGRVVAEPAASVVLITGFGGTRMVDMLVGDPLPRIC